MTIGKTFHNFLKLIYQLDGGFGEKLSRAISASYTTALRAYIGTGGSENFFPFIPTHMNLPADFLMGFVQSRRYTTF